MNDNEKKPVEVTTETEKKVKKINVLVNIIGLSIFLVICVVVAIVLVPYLKQFFNDPVAFKDYIKENGFLGMLLFVTIQVLQVIISLIPGEFVEIAAGISFGWFGGLILCEVGVTIGTVIIFIVCKKLGRPIIDLYIGKGKLKKFEQLDKSPKRDTILFIIFLIPGLPKDILIYAASFFSISLKRFLVISLIARIPSIITSTIAGSYLLEKNYTMAIIIFIITGLIAIISYFMYNKIYKHLVEGKNKKIENK